MFETRIKAIISDFPGYWPEERVDLAVTKDRQSGEDLLIIQPMGFYGHPNKANEPNGKPLIVPVAKIPELVPYRLDYEPQDYIDAAAQGVAVDDLYAFHPVPLEWRGQRVIMRWPHLHTMVNPYLRNVVRGIVKLGNAEEGRKEGPVDAPTM